MAVTTQGCAGTIGGGLVEDDMRKLAEAMLRNNDPVPRILQRAHHASKSIEPSGMICGGEQTILIYPCRPSDKAIIKRLLNCSEHDEPCLLRVSAQGLQILPRTAAEPTPTFKAGEDWYYQECIGRLTRAFIIGGGHVSVALSKVLDMLKFDITVIDERQAETLPVNTYAKKIRTLPYPGIAAHIPEGQDVFVFIMTHLHQTDEWVLAELAGKRLAYLGLLGSRRKIDGIIRNLSRKCPNVCLQNLHAPIGLPIGSHTPEEIAISIAAEVIMNLHTQSAR